MQLHVSLKTSEVTHPPPSAAHWKFSGNVGKCDVAELYDQLHLKQFLSLEELNITAIPTGLYTAL